MATAIERMAKLDELEGKLVEMRQCLKELAVWEAVQAQGHRPEDVLGLTWREDFLGYHDRRLRRRAREHFNRYGVETDPFEGKFNAAVLKNGTVAKLDPMVAAAPQ